MSSTTSHALRARVLKDLAAEREAALRAAWEGERAREITEEAERQAALDSALSTKKQAIAERERRGRAELDALAAEIAREKTLAEDDRRVQAVRSRFEDFRGNDDASIRDRLRREGVPDALLQRELRERTLDQSVGNELGMGARFTQDVQYQRTDPTRAARQGDEPDRQYFRGTEPAEAPEQFVKPREMQGAVTSAADVLDEKRGYKRN